MKCCCMNCQNKACPWNSKNAPKGEPIKYVAFIHTKLCKGHIWPWKGKAVRDAAQAAKLSEGV